MLRAPSVGRHHSTIIVDEERNICNIPAINIQGTNHTPGGEEEPAIRPRVRVTTRKEGEMSVYDNNRD